MMYRLTALGGALLCSAFASAPAMSAVLYDNGPAIQSISARPINFSNSYANSFTLAQDSVVSGIVFTSSDLFVKITSVGWSITPTVDFSSALTNAAVTSTFLYTQVPNGYQIDNNSFSTGPLNLAAGTYYLRLANAVTTGNSSAYWSVSNGPSQAYGNGFRSDQSQAFQVIGTAATATGAVPEPASWAMMIAGIGLVGASLRRRKVTVRFA